jgi:hypothetical protein
MTSEDWGGHALLRVGSNIKLKEEFVLQVAFPSSTAQSLF